jgi:hypothetical protein
MTSARQAALTRTAGRLWWLPLVPFGFLADRSSRWRWLLMPGIVILTALTSSVAKLVIRRPRPDSARHLAPRGRLAAAGFPSTHSACAFAIAGWLRTSRHGPGLHTTALLIGYSRVHRRAHHVTDVVAGAILGYGVAWQVERTWSRLTSSRAARVVGNGSEHYRAGSSRRRTIQASSHDLSPGPRDHLGAVVIHERSLRSTRRHIGVAPPERRGAKGTPQEVG